MDSPPVEEARATPARETIEDTLAVSYARVSYMTAWAGISYSTTTISNHLWLPPGFEVSGGGRVGFFGRLEKGVCFEGFVAAAIVPHFPTALDQAKRAASWRPALGVELGYTTATLDPDRRTPESDNMRNVQTRGVYGAVAARPLRFRFGNLHASSAGITFGTLASQPGKELRLQIELLQLGMVF